MGLHMHYVLYFIYLSHFHTLGITCSVSVFLIRLKVSREQGACLTFVLYSTGNIISC